MQDSLTWDAVFEIALALKTQYPQADLEKTSLEEIFQWTINLASFEDDPDLANDDILTAILREWYEENNPI
ncbi:MAG: Fe-S cluster assembly protein IscX [Chloroflexi bacterium]|nr:Fe-S cluster assembly protein IscX [Chloroflexota bacterium]